MEQFHVPLVAYNLHNNYSSYSVLNGFVSLCSSKTFEEEVMIFTELEIFSIE